MKEISLFSNVEAATSYHSQIQKLWEGLRDWQLYVDDWSKSVVEELDIAGMRTVTERFYKLVT
jgi:hypothetical protein